MTDRPRVLVVEDNQEIRELEAEILRDGGYEVTSVADGAGALRTLDAGDIDVLVVDLNLDDVSGIEVARHAHRGHPRLAIVISTGLLNITQAEIADLKADVIEKPFIAAELLTKVETAFRDRAR